MIMAPRMLWLVVLVHFVLVLFCGGCGSMRPARWADAPADTGNDGHVPRVAEVGNWVRVERLDGSRVSGRLVACAPDSVSIKTERKVGYQWVHETQVIPRAEIRAVQRKQVSLGRTLLVTGCVVVGLGVAFVISLGTGDWQWEAAK